MRWDRDYNWLGPTRIPPICQVFGMTDRVTGTVYYPQVTADGIHIVFSNQAPSSAPTRVYGPYDGPFVGNYSFRMGISSGRVVVDAYPDSGAGPFVRGISLNTLAAVFYAKNIRGGSGFDHLAFQSAPVQGSIFDPTP